MGSLAGVAHHLVDVAVGLQRGNHMLSIHLALRAIRFDLGADFSFFGTHDVLSLQ
jgi:hypothetical protein